jgi:hypothetical protein
MPAHTKKSKPKRKSSPLRRTLTGKEVKRLRPAIAAALRERAGDWGLQGWSIVGREPRLRIAVRVPLRRISPRASVEAITVKGIRFKPAVIPTFTTLRPRDTNGPAASGVQPYAFAPGSPIVVDGQERCGVGAFLQIDDEPHVVTCGHAFGDAGGRVRTLDSKEDVARLTYDLREQPFYLDAAVCSLTDWGLEQASDSRDAETWTAKVHTPGPSDNGRDCVLWPTHDDVPDGIELSVLSFSTDFFPFCESPAGGCSFIEAEYVAPEGDSGGPLTIDGAYYGICRGTNSHSTFFTPVASVVSALQTQGKTVRPWSPE